MTAFFNDNPATLVLLIIGGFFLFMTYGALITSIRSGHFVSGVPLVGGIFIFLAFIISDKKILCLLCLLDYGFFMLPYSAIWSLWLNKRIKAFAKEAESMGYTAAEPAHAEKLHVTYPFNNKTYWDEMPLGIPLAETNSKLLYMPCIDDKGREFIAVQKYRPRSEIRFVPFDEGEADIGDGVTVKRVIG